MEINEFDEDPYAIEEQDVIDGVRERLLKARIDEAYAEAVAPPEMVEFTNQHPQPYDTPWVVEYLIPRGGTIANTAQKKAGKTTMTGNLIRALVSGEDFLGEFQVMGRYTVALADLEMSPGQHAKWLIDMGLHGNRRLYVMHLNGRARSFPLWPGARREQIVQQLRQIEADVLIVDPVGPLFRAHGVEENSIEAARVIDALKEIAADAGVSVLFYNLHAGKDLTKGARGYSGLEDIPDVIWRMEGQRDQPAHIFRAWGRDVDETRGLVYDKETRKLAATTGGNVNGLPPESNLSAITAAVQENPALGKKKLFETAREDSYGYTSNWQKFLSDLDTAEQLGLIVNRGTENRPKFFPPDTGE